MAYTYLIGWSKTNKYYYGVRFAKKSSPEELWESYFTSSKHVKEYTKNHGEPDIIQVRKVFDDVDKARLWESKVLKRMKVVDDDRFINKTDNVSIDLKSCKSMLGKFGKKHPAYGRKRDDLSQYNKLNNKYRENNHWLGKKGNNHPAYGNRFENKVMKEVLTCPHCNTTGKRGGMQRWHFDKCKFINKYKNS
jgi:hypothetical protein